MKNLAKEVKREIRRRLSHDSYAGKEYIAIHKNTAKHILKILKKKV